MSFFARSLPGLAAGAVLLVAAVVPPDAHAGASKEGAYVRIILKDGVVLQGKVRREGKYEIDEQSVIFLPSGFFFLDDGVRRQYISPSLVQQDPVETPPPDGAPIRPKNWDIRVRAEPNPAVDEILEIGPWDDKWDRTVKFRSALTTKSVHQRLIGLTPYYAQTQAVERYLWQAMYLTRELGPDQVRQLLSSQPEFSEQTGLAPDAAAARRFKYCDFMAQAGFYDEAEGELTRLTDDRPTPAVQKQAQAARELIASWRRRDELEAIKKRHNAGQFDEVRRKLAGFDVQSADANTVAEVNELRDKYKAADQAVADAGRFLDELPARLAGGDQDKPLAEAAAALRAELRPDLLPRLEAFLGQARQAERQAAAGQTPAVGPAGLLAFAVTGWLGLPPESKPETAVRLWRARQFVLKYLNSDIVSRKSQLDSYESARNTVTLDDFVRLIPLLPPPEPEEKVTEETTERTAGRGPAAVKYLLRLPPEYRPGRNYPVLIVLHDAGAEPEEMLDRWRDAAALNGYILAAPEWKQPHALSYQFSDREHAAVLETLRDLRRHFAVDSDRVFLFGLGQGGAMAFDVGLSHPDQFAGVLPMSAGPEKFSERYYRNAEYLPFYIVSGDHTDRPGDDLGMRPNQRLREQFEYWVNLYPMLWIQYKGRGVEWFGGEVPLMFDWMRGKKREFPLQQLGGTGFGADVQKCFITHRATDDHFYWLSTDGIDAHCINSGASWDRKVRPARMQAKIDLENNLVMMDTAGLSQITLWLGANDKGEPMVNFDKPLTVRWTHDGGPSTVWKDRPATRSLATLLEDLADRGDRQHLFTAKLEFAAK